MHPTHLRKRLTVLFATECGLAASSPTYCWRAFTSVLKHMRFIHSSETWFEEVLPSIKLYKYMERTIESFIPFGSWRSPSHNTIDLAISSKWLTPLEMQQHELILNDNPRSKKSTSSPSLSLLQTQTAHTIARSKTIKLYEFTFS